MSQKVFFLFLMAGHALGDFYFQTDHMVKRKNHAHKAILAHALWYTALMGIVVLPIIPLQISGAMSTALLLRLIFVTHALIDFAKIRMDQKNAPPRQPEPLSQKSPKNQSSFLADQAAHMLSLLILSYYFCGSFATNAIGRHLVAWESSLPSAIPVRPLALFVALMYVVKPTSIAISDFLSGAKQNTPHPSGFPNAGAIIGILERLLILALLLSEQYSAIGFVFTAKSVARYSEINNQRLEAEYYLLGTLLSLVSVGVIMLLARLYFP
jgi:hypothetical protein